jgi:hypothetical protein
MPAERLAEVRPKPQGYRGRELGINQPRQVETIVMWPSRVATIRGQMPTCLPRLVPDRPGMLPELVSPEERTELFRREQDLRWVLPEQDGALCEHLPRLGDRSRPTIRLDQALAHAILFRLPGEYPCQHKAIIGEHQLDLAWEPRLGESEAVDLHLLDHVDRKAWWLNRPRGRPVALR